MAKLVHKIVRQIISFVCNQYLILFFILTLGLKLAYFNTYITKVIWPSSQYDFGIAFGYISIAVLFLPLLFFKKYKNKLAIILATVISALILIDTVYYSYFTALPGVGLLSSIGQAGSVGPAILGLMHWQLILYFVDIILIMVFHKQVRQFFEWLKTKFDIVKQNNITSLLAAIVTIIILFMALFPMSPIKFNDIIDKGYDTVSTSQYYGLIMSHAVDTIRFIKQETTHLSAAQEGTLINWVKNNKPAQIVSDLNGIAKDKNVIMIQVESLGGFVINQTVNGKEVTPNLDKLTQTSQFFPNNRFVIGAGHTSDTDFVANTSYFPLTDAAVFVRYGQDNFDSLPKTLINNGYSAYAYHGFNRSFWNRDVALASLGYQKFYAADSYPKGTMINMGLNDGDFLSKTAEYIKDQPKPSFSYAITLTSHVPFSIIDQTKELGININDYPSQVGGYLENINYVDRMLGKFFEKLKTEGLYDDSLIVIYGDHVPVLTAFSAGTIDYNPETIQGKEAPLIIKLPQETTGKTYQNQGTNLDIMPTILDLTGIKTDNLMFGQSVFANKTNGAMGVCVDQLVVFSESADCKSKLTEEKNKSAEIIRYNQFHNL